jgi:hypothetical protein
MAHLRESVVAVLETLLARQKDSAAGKTAKADPDKARGLLEQADSAIRQARSRCLDWTLEEPALLEIIYNDAAQAISAKPPSPNGDTPVIPIIHKVISERGHMGLKLITDLQGKLVTPLEVIGQEMPLVQIDVPSVKNLVFRGMPSVDVVAAGIDAQVKRPWYATFSRSFAEWQIKQNLHKKLGRALQEKVEHADRQLLAWIKGCLDQLVGAYEDQADIVPQQVMRLANGGDQETLPSDEVEQLEADLRELRNQPEVALSGETKN